MPIRFVCPACWSSYEIDASLDGTRIRCRDCHGIAVAKHTPAPEPRKLPVSSSRGRLRVAPPPPTPPPVLQLAEGDAPAACRCCARPMHQRVPCPHCTAQLCSERCVDDHCRRVHVRQIPQTRYCKTALTFAIAGLVVPFFSLVGVGFGIAGLASGERNHGEGIAAIIVGLFGSPCLLFLVWLVFFASGR